PQSIPVVKRPRFVVAHRVARLRAVLVMRGDRLGAVDLLAVKTVRKATLHRDGHRLLHLVAHHGPGTNFPAAAFDHADALSFRIVCIRAISRRIARSCSGLVSDSVARRNSRRNRSSVRTTSFCSSSSVLSPRSSSGRLAAGILPFLPLHEL